MVNKKEYTCLNCGKDLHKVNEVTTLVDDIAEYMLGKRKNFCSQECVNDYLGYEFNGLVQIGVRDAQ